MNIERLPQKVHRQTTNHNEPRSCGSRANIRTASAAVRRIASTQRVLLNCYP